MRAQGGTCTTFTEQDLHDGILHDGMHPETLKIHFPKASEVSSQFQAFLQQANERSPKKKTVYFIVCKTKVYVSRTLSTRHFESIIYFPLCLLFSVSV